MKQLVFIAACLLSVNLSAQMLVDNSQSPSQLINDVLLGEGIDASNITMNGDGSDALSIQLGSFNATNSNIGIGHGIILATGGVSVAESPNDIPTAYVTVPEEDELTQEPDLASIMAPAELNDVAVIEFDFTAKGDTLRFKYVFASEEYNEHTCSTYNDAFGFFISGPGITGNGSFENNARNVALVPGTDVPVAINSVNQGFAGTYGANSVCNALSPDWQDNAIYFVDNENNSALTATQFDGFTVPFLVEIPVECGGTYHIKIAIADAVDGKNDSAVFIEAGSFESEAPLEAALSIVDPNNQGQAQEGCSALNLHMERSDSTDIKTVYVRAEGFSDVESILPDLPDSINFYPHQGVIDLTLDIYDNTLNEGLRDAKILLLQPEVCSLDTVVFELPFPLFDVAPMILDYPDEIVLACDEIGQVNVSVSGGNPPYQIDWQGGYDGFNFDVSPESEELLTAVVTDACSLNQATVEILVYRQSYLPLEVIVPATVNYNCTDVLEIIPVVNGGSGEYTYEWFIGGELISTSPVFSEILNSETSINLKVYDPCVELAISVIEVNSILNPIVVNLGPDTTGTCAEQMTIVPEVYGGFGDLQFEWSLNQFPVSSDASFSFIPSQTSLLRLAVNDACGQSSEDDLLVFMNEAPLQIILSEDTIVCPFDHLFIEPEIAGGFGELNYSWNGTPAEDGVLSTFPEESSLYVLEVTDACGRSQIHEMDVTVSDVHSDFLFQYENEFQLIDNNSTLDCIYYWTFPDGADSDQYEPLVNLETLRDGYTHLKVVNEYGCEDHSRKRFEPVHSLFIPNAFTPDGDGLNDVFKAEGQYIASFEMRIYDRWGTLLFMTDDISKGWDGENADRSKYAAQDFVFNYKYILTSWTGEVEEGMGKIHMLR